MLYAERSINRQIVIFQNRGHSHGNTQKLNNRELSEEQKAKFKYAKLKSSKLKLEHHPNISAKEKIEHRVIEYVYCLHG